MIIQSHDISLSSYRRYEQRDTFVEELREWGPGADEAPDESVAEEPDGAEDRISISSQAKAAFKSQVMESLPQSEIEEIDSDDEILGDARMVTLKKLVEFITGKKINLTRVLDDVHQSSTGGVPGPAKAPEETEEQEQEQGWGMSYSAYESYYEYESTSFSASGMIKTADGQDISFSLDLEMSREYYTEGSVEIKAGEPLIDPLVVNYSGNAAELSDMTFQFDLDADGDDESVNYLKPGSGFLVLDQNQDGKINDGSEMFGPSTGNGFQELSAYDDDGNNWIDENDAIYNRLALWDKSETSDSLSGLKDSDVGAIYLGNVKTRFDLKNQANELYGRIQKAGVYLSESGTAGSVQQIDFSQ